nr:tRNA (adenosine(37)-N6)-threonylcarbamoyltransferase complex dimerization subunit type 1 TsaB [Candidatus Kapabacteria bacterium]
AIHEEAIVTIVETALGLARCTFDSVGAIALSSGPGSFTGLRIGASFAKGLCFDGRISLLAVPTSSALALACARRAGEPPRLIMTAIAANRDLVYVGTFGADGSPMGEVQAIPSAEARNGVSDDMAVVGPSATTIAQRASLGVEFLSSRWIAEYACSAIDAGTPWTDVATYQPDYRQDFVGSKPKPRM